MNAIQILTPKYWIGHDTKTDDVFLLTAKKDYSSCYDRMSEYFGDDWKDNNTSFEISLVEINLVEMKES